MFPLEAFAGILIGMNQRLAEHRIRLTCRELLASGRHLSGRALRQELRQRYGAVGRTARVFQIWREETQPKCTVAPDVAALERQVAEAKAAAAADLARAERAEVREQAHQDHWALEVDRLRQELKAQPQYAKEIRRLQDQVMRLTVELHAARALLAQRD